ncbi:uncharacterized protein LOC142231038 [Haematobia irritans]|uniref:uncharacterized protein LOC142231038 n=1 Tax=Haematobia irritans TaxID=7368 RepID=UPI003F50398E
MYQEIPSVNRNLRVESLNATCEYTSDLVKQLECNVIKMTTNRFAINVLFELNRKLPSYAEVGIVLNFRPLLGQKVIRFVDIKLRICDVLRNVKIMPLIKGIIDKVRSFSNIPVTCPFRGDYIYTISNLNITNDLFPSWASAMQFNFTMHFYLNQKRVAMYHLAGIAVEKKN